MAGADTANVEAQTKNLLQGVENQKAVEALTNVQTNLAKIQESIAGRTENDVVTYAAWNAQKMIHDAEIAAANDYVANQTMDTTIRRIKTETIGAMLENVLTKAKTRNTNADTAKIKQDMLNAGSSNSKSMEGMAMMVNTQLMQAQKANIEADTKKTLS